jgi:phosphoribosyl 1,2-cyclic phosphate phosphodiesterase
LQVTFLGTGTSQGVPVIGCNCRVCRSADPRDRRMRTALMIEASGERIVIDAGPDFRNQMLQHNVDRISALLLTHEHYDHIAGIDDLRSFNYVMNRAVPIWSEKRVMDVLQRQFPYIFAKDKYPGTPNIELKELSNSTFFVGSMSITPIRLWHYKLPVFGFRVGKVAYITDVSRIPEEEMSKFADLDLLIVDALRIEPHISHFCLDEAMALVERVKPRQARFVHVSHKLGLFTEVQKLLPENVRPAYDGLVLNF